MKVLFYALIVLFTLSIPLSIKAQLVVDETLFLKSDVNTSPHQLQEVSLVKQFTEEVTTYFRPFFTSEYWREALGWATPTSANTWRPNGRKE